MHPNHSLSSLGNMAVFWWMSFESEMAVWPLSVYDNITYLWIWLMCVLFPGSFIELLTYLFIYLFSKTCLSSSATRTLWDSCTFSTGSWLSKNIFLGYWWISVSDGGPYRHQTLQDRSAWGTESQYLLKACHREDSRRRMEDIIGQSAFLWKKIKSVSPGFTWTHCTFLHTGCSLPSPAITPFRRKPFKRHR